MRLPGNGLFWKYGCQLFVGQPSCKNNSSSYRTTQVFGGLASKNLQIILFILKIIEGPIILDVQTMAIHFSIKIAVLQLKASESFLKIVFYVNILRVSHNLSPSAKTAVTNSHILEDFYWAQFYRHQLWLISQCPDDQKSFVAHLLDLTGLASKSKGVDIWPQTALLELYVINLPHLKVKGILCLMKKNIC